MTNIEDKILEKDEYILAEYTTGEKVFVRDLQLAILPIMDEIHRICVKHDIPYALVAGSALGIYNYKGFLPWDDDIDMCVPINDWPRFMEALKQDLDPEFYFQCFETDKQYNVLIPTMKIRRRGTYHKEVNFLLRNRCASGDGVFVDVTIYDNISENTWVDEAYRMLIKLLVPFIVVFDNLGINPVFFKKLAIKITKHYSKVNQESKFMSDPIIVPWVGFMGKRFFLKEDLLPFQLYEFEGRQYYSYKNLEKVLVTKYGPNCLRKWDGEKWIETYHPKKRKAKHTVELNLNGEGPRPKSETMDLEE